MSNKLHVAPGNLVTPDQIQNEEKHWVASVYDTNLTPVFAVAPEMLDSLRDAVLFMQFLDKNERRLTDSEQRWLNNAVALLHKAEGLEPISELAERIKLSLDKVERDT